MHYLSRTNKFFILVYLLSLCACSSHKVEKWPEPIIVQATGNDYKWNFIYAGADAKLGTPDDINTGQNFSLPSKTKAILKIKSSDYIYTFGLPDFSAKEIAVPGLEHQIELTTERKGTFDLKGDQLCGYTHESLLGELNVKSNSQFQKWITSYPSKNNQ
ncbi:MAG: cytochrome c oxidase subunit 2 [Polaribacter sp.]|jgi:cytochrome c oxidase subunit 2